MRIAWNNSNLTPVQSVGAVAQRPQLGGGGPSGAAAVAPDLAEQMAGQSPANLTPDNLRAALLEIGMTGDAETLALAETFARLGLPLTESNLVEGRAILARYPKLPAAAYAMAKLLDAPLSPGVLRALARVLENSLSNSPLPEEVLGKLSLALQGGDDPRKLARDLYQIIARLGQSTEERLAQAGDTPDELTRALFRSDPRAQLLTLVNSQIGLDRATRAAADAHAAHVEGQQLLNKIALERFDPPVPLYFAFPYRIGSGQTVATEIQVWTRDENEEKKAADEFDDKKLVLQTIIRLAPPRLGQMEIRLSGRQDATLGCQVLVERPATLRLLARSSAELAQGLASAGWHIDKVSVGMTEEFAPLWYGGASLAQPRGRVDQKA